MHVATTKNARTASTASIFVAESAFLSICDRYSVMVVNYR